MNKEIERKFLISQDSLLKLRVHKTYGKSYIEQNYLAIGNEEVRVRYKENSNLDSEYTLTVKNGSGIEREEFEKVITKDTYDQLNKRTEPVKKYREKIELNSLVVEIDEYINEELKGLMIAEIEFKTIEEAIEFSLPEWAIKDVTDNKSYKNQSLWKTINLNVDDYDGMIL